MTRLFDPSSLQFFLTVPSPCPYLPDRMERKIFTQLDPLSGPSLNDYLTHSGFRRSQNVIYRPACESCRSCKSLRVITPDYRPSKSQKRTLKRNQTLTREHCEPFATREQFTVLQKYLHARHPDGGMSDMTYERYEMMVEDCASRTEIIEYRDVDNTLIAACLTDQLSDGLSMVYSYFDPELSKMGLGTYMILDHINICNALGLHYLYLGYWVEDSPKMDYKTQFQPHEVLGKLGWHPKPNTN